MSETNAGVVRQRSVEIVAPVYELLVPARRDGLRVHEAPVDRSDACDSRADVVSTAVDDLGGTVRMLRSPLTGRTRVPALPRRTSTPQVPAARTTTPVAVLPAGANTHLEYAS
ncbi:MULTISPECIES: hypothetical protein [unclassified Streptomyces]|uniref:hypothetical protein n=1 Tax=unclassified Streptomyces TaxID=2593676 RepID=UPI0033A80752